jgi:hypothetical protein
MPDMIRQDYRYLDIQHSIKYPSLGGFTSSRKVPPSIAVTRQDIARQEALSPHLTAMRRRTVQGTCYLIHIVLTWEGFAAK